MNQPKKNALGRVLDALIMMDDIKSSGPSSINETEISKIKANPDQPRREFDEKALEELAASIKALGIIQPITLRQTGPESYQIIAGERRFRASSLAGKTTIPAYIRTAEDDHVVEMALIENIQREDLNAIEIALTYQKLIDQYGLTQENLSERIGKKRATITNYLRLLKLPAEIQIGLKNKNIDFGHARALLALSDPEDQLCIYEQIQEHHLSVRKTEEIIRNIQNGQTTATAAAPKSGNPRLAEEFGILKNHLSKFFETKVQFTCDENGKGKISIPFKSEEELERIIGIFDKLGH